MKGILGKSHPNLMWKSFPSHDRLMAVSCPCAGGRLDIQLGERVGSACGSCRSSGCPGLKMAFKGTSFKSHADLMLISCQTHVPLMSAHVDSC